MKVEITNNPDNKQESYEIEKRAIIENESDFTDLRARLNEVASFLGEKTLTTVLFKNPNFIRIRISDGDHFFTVTEKSGDYTDKARLETNIQYPLSELKQYFVSLKNNGYQEGTELKTQRFTYQYDKDIKVELNIIDYLGMIAEVEAMTDDDKKIDELEAKVKTVLSILQLENLEGESYQAMMNQMYLAATKPIDEITLSK